MLQRVKHLGAIVTSEDWDLHQQGMEVEAITEEEGIDLDLEVGKEAEQQVTRLSRRVR